ncbi:DUF4369 domain-containing protein [Lutibacter sp. HS1-25]|uniref:DUF4369 domain-containing protein n=1 Tax=Lutibacter sp. HS1-25 TaxID=2485000 RepID=UPI00101097CF|nr:DUF4369 domain-containing protein [Lutibacter sp. HS1-25]RXP53375.1 DUF4369 domain-containing protein [Lutibacter sp. HS1-25]
MKKLIPFIIIASLIISCGKDHQGNMIVKGNIDGLKKGTLYLQKIQDTVLVSVDSVQLNGDSNFILSDNVESPELYYITLGEVSSEKIPFFGEKGEITITSKLDRLATSAKITGSANQLILDEFKEVYKKFNNQQLDLIKGKFEAMKANDTDAELAAEDAGKKLLKRRYLYTTNFAIQHADSEVAPFLALTELYDANIKLLDTINNSLTKEIKVSKYGVKLNNYIEEIKSYNE